MPNDMLLDLPPLRNIRNLVLVGEVELYSELMQRVITLMLIDGQDRFVVNDLHAYDLLLTTLTGSGAVTAGQYLQLIANDIAAAINEDDGTNTINNILVTLTQTGQSVKVTIDITTASGTEEGVFTIG